MIDYDVIEHTILYNYVIYYRLRADAGERPGVGLEYA